MDATISRSEFRRLNERRLDLIDKKYSVGLTDDEAAQLETVGGKVSDWMRVNCPRDTALQDDAAERLASLKAKVAARKAEGRGRPT